MLRIEIAANFRPRPMEMTEGLDAGIALLTALADLDAFQDGWMIEGADLRRDRADFISAAQAQLAGEGADGGFFFLIAENARRAMPTDTRYLFDLSFNNSDGALDLQLGMVPALARLPMIRATLRALGAWSPLQHVSVTEMFYSPEDSPIDPSRRRGLGWAGWVPFELMDDQVPEAEVIEPMGRGTFLASQIDYWEVSDRAAVKRAQALELRLNELGALPTHRDIGSGTWGDLR